jgi:hypothetical protein
MRKGPGSVYENNIHAVKNIPYIVYMNIAVVPVWPSWIRVITKLPNSEQSYKGKVKTHNYINRQNQSTTGKL